MEKRKNPEKDLRNKSGLFFQIGLLSAMFLTVCAFEYKQEVTLTDLSCAFDQEAEPEWIVPITDIPPPPPPPKVVKNVVAVDDPVEVDIPDDIILDQQDLLDVEIPDVVPEDETPVETVEEVFTIVESMPEPAGGYEAFYKFVNKKLKYPGKARRMSIEGTVYMSFVVNEKGEMTDIKIAKGIGAGCDEEVLRIFQNPPKWVPGKQRGVPVKVNKIMPIKFVLN